MNCKPFIIIFFLIGAVLILPNDILMSQGKCRPYKKSYPHTGYSVTMKEGLPNSTMRPICSIKTANESSIYKSHNYHLLHQYRLLYNSSASATNWYDSVIVREDNDFTTCYDTSSKTKPAPAILRELCSVRYSEDISGRNQIFEVSFNELLIYVIRHAGIGYEIYDLWAYDKNKNKLSEKPFTINGKWSVDNEAGFVTPILNGSMIETIGNSIMLRERRHNGNSYNAVLLYCLKCNKRLEFELQYCIEECSLCHTPEMASSEYLIIKRDVKKNLDFYTPSFSGFSNVGKLPLLLLNENFQVNCYSTTDLQSKHPIGSFKLSGNGTIKKIIVLDTNYQNIIVTASGIDPSTFSKNGLSHQSGIMRNSTRRTNP